MEIQIKRAYEKPSKQDGKRILIDRLWPRGITKVDAKIDIWLKDIAPSSELRKWFGHDPKRWDEFKSRYLKEIKNNKEVLSELNKIVEIGKTTLIYSAKDEEHNNAVVLKDLLENK